jgi:hypothetical protein
VSRLAALLALLALLALPAFVTCSCSPSTAPADPATTGAPTAPAPATAAPAEGVIIGAWSSPSCGDRTYPREITFDEAGGFHAADLVSPCPPNVACVWSGIVHYSGKYSVSGATITLVIEEGKDQKMGKPLPSSLSIAAANGAPTEKDANGAACVYKRAAPSAKK